jgi:hypothetical protein
MTELAYIAAVLFVALAAWDAFRRWVEAKHAATLAQDKNEANQRAIHLLQTQYKLLEQTLGAQRMGLDECLVRLDTFKAQSWPTRDQLRDLEESTHKELRALDDELRASYKRADKMEQALLTTAGEVRDLVQKQTAWFATRAGNVRAG